MSDIYIAKQSVGQYRTGEVIDGLTDDRIKFLLAENAIEKQAVKSEPKVKDEPKPTAKTTKKA